MKRGSKLLVSVKLQEFKTDSF